MKPSQRIPIPAPSSITRHSLPTSLPTINGGMVPPHPPPRPRSDHDADHYTPSSPAVEDSPPPPFQGIKRIRPPPRDGEDSTSAVRRVGAPVAHSPTETTPLSSVNRVPHAENRSNLVSRVRSTSLCSPASAASDSPASSPAPRRTSTAVLAPSAHHHHGNHHHHHQRQHFPDLVVDAPESPKSPHRVTVRQRKRSDINSPWSLSGQSGNTGAMTSSPVLSVYQPPLDVQANSAKVQPAVASRSSRNSTSVLPTWFSYTSTPASATVGKISTKTSGLDAISPAATSHGAKRLSTSVLPNLVTSGYTVLAPVRRVSELALRRCGNPNADQNVVNNPGNRYELSSGTTVYNNNDNDNNNNNNNNNNKSYNNDKNNNNGTGYNVSHCRQSSLPSSRTLPPVRRAPMLSERSMSDPHAVSPFNAPPSPTSTTAQRYNPLTRLRKRLSRSSQQNQPQQQQQQHHTSSSSSTTAIRSTSIDYTEYASYVGEQHPLLLQHRQQQQQRQQLQQNKDEYTGAGDGGGGSGDNGGGGDEKKGNNDEKTTTTSDSPACPVCKSPVTPCPLYCSPTHSPVATPSLVHHAHRSSSTTPTPSSPTTPTPDSVNVGFYRG